MSIKFLLQHVPASAVVMALILAVHPNRSRAAVANIQVGSGGNRFVPAVTNIFVNDQVIWTWAGNFHSTTSGNGSPSGLWDSGVHNVPFSFTNTFNSSGTFAYYCTIHFGSGMTGSIIVQAAANPPSVAITSPAQGAVFSAPASAGIQAAVTPGSGSVTNVQFLADGAVVANKIAPPYSATADGLTAGAHTLAAIASDANGLSATNTISISVVTAVDVLLANGAKVSASEFDFTYSANPGLSYVVERSSDLINWKPLATNTASANPSFFADSDATNAASFYRVQRLPNP